MFRNGWEMFQIAGKSSKSFCHSSYLQNICPICTIHLSHLLCKSVDASLSALSDLFFARMATHKVTHVRSRTSAYNSKHITALENIGTGRLQCKWWRLVIPSPTPSHCIAFNVQINVPFVEYSPARCIPSSIELP